MAAEAFPHMQPDKAAAEIAALKAQGAYHRPIFEGICDAATCLRPAHWRVGDPSEYVPRSRPVRRKRG